MLVQQLAGMPTPEALASALAEQPGLAWLDSAGAAGGEGRYSFVTALPDEVRRVPLGAPRPFQLLDTLAAEVAPAAAGSGETRETGRPPSAAEVPHWIGYIAFDALRSGSGAAGPQARSGPALVLARYPALLVIDHAHARVFVAGDDTQACERLVALATRPAREPRALAGALTSTDPAEHARAIERALALIARGDLYQVNLARRFCAELSGDPLALALAMRRESPVPLGFYYDDGERRVIGRSMERFIRWDAHTRTLVTRPIKGTVERTGDDAGERAALWADPKERAEHTMIIDLMRNDLGRVAEIGSVRVLEQLQVEPFAHLQHLVSTVACTTRSDVRASDILYATFPPGSVTGTPKLRAIAAIEALEAAQRGIYTGAFGYVDRAGGLSLAVAIRTAVVEAGVASYFAGGGIVEASDVAREIAETELKARVFVNALHALDR